MRRVTGRVIVGALHARGGWTTLENDHMHRPIARAAILLAVVLTLPPRVAAQERDGIMGDLLRDAADVQGKITALASALPASAYEWRPAKGVRSAGETLMHVAADNYFLPAAMGVSAPPETGINGKDFKSAVAFEKRPMARERIIKEVEKSFAFLQASMSGMPDASLNSPLDVFGRKTTNRGLWISTVTHLHEHLGQLIAYARSNNVTPPWSK